MPNQQIPNCPPVDPIMTSPQRIVRDHYHHQVVQVIHPVEIINRHHCIPIYQHKICYTERDEMA
ncbi:hypothetical protein EHS13_14615 [Paenibacillus psychroresistens]|uniref:Spore coat protein D n=1 Tax=Paenibacillus psychroresistens TaxID=1778678 RepID=A0A6B8RHT3_9BACL|nr:hypothetical protein [Paenibacillus psychroresistens]QGQ96021.1 hypothetical protein EHS13_14615 [Paenibacillus psychroresistens]